MPGPMEREMHFRESEGGKKLAYAEEFKQFIAEHQSEHLFERTKNLVRELLGRPSKSKGQWGWGWDEEEAISDGDISATYISRNLEAGYFRVTYGDKKFFLKIAFPRKEREHPWHNLKSEVLADKRARELLRDIKGVDVVDFQFGYRENDGTSWFVSEWYDLPTMAAYLEKAQEEGRDVAGLRKRLKRAKRILLINHFFETGKNHEFYDPDRDKIIFFDLQIGED